MVHLPVSLCIYICEPACGECFPLPPDPAFTRPRPRPGGPRPSAQLPSQTRVQVCLLYEGCCKLSVTSARKYPPRLFGSDRLTAMPGRMRSVNWQCDTFYLTCTD